MDRSLDGWSGRQTVRQMDRQIEKIEKRKLESAEGETNVCGQTEYRTQDLWLTSQVPSRLRYAAQHGQKEMDWQMDACMDGWTDKKTEWQTDRHNTRTDTEIDWSIDQVWLSTLYTYYAMEHIQNQLTERPEVIYRYIDSQIDRSNLIFDLDSFIL